SAAPAARGTRDAAHRGRPTSPQRWRPSCGAGARARPPPATVWRAALREARRPRAADRRYRTGLSFLFIEALLPQLRQDALADFLAPGLADHHRLLGDGGHHLDQLLSRRGLVELDDVLDLGTAQLLVVDGDDFFDQLLGLELLLQLGPERRRHVGQRGA